MTDLVFKGANNQVLTNSLLVAEKFGKRHSDVIRSIEKILTVEDSSLNAKMRSVFESTTYEDLSGKNNPMYVMNEKGFSILVMGWTGVKALRFKDEFYDAFENMRNKLISSVKPMSQLEILQMSIGQLVEQEKRLSNVEQRIDRIEQERAESEKALMSADLSQNKSPQMTMQARVNQLVQKYTKATNIRQQIVWHKVYENLYYLYHISIKAYKKISKNESNLSVATRNGFIDKIYDIISNMIREKGLNISLV